MAKRKDVSGEPGGRKGKDSDDPGSEDDMEMLDVDFEWFDPQPAVDFHGLKTLLRQLFDVDNQLFDLSELVGLILSQPKLGSTVKVDGNESDPFAFLTVLNTHQHSEKQVIKDLTSYLLSKASQSPSLAPLKDLLSPSSPAQIGLVLTERLINMPPEIAPPMYTMLLEEMQWALEEKEPYAFTHYLVWTKTYTEVASQLDAEADRPSKKKRKEGDGAGGRAETFYFHPEDEVLQRYASASAGFDYTKQGDEEAADARRAFHEMGMRPQGRVILIEAAKFEEAVRAVGKYLGARET